MKLIRSFFLKIHYTIFVFFIEWEIYHKIFPFLLKKKNYEYPFDSDEGLLMVNIQAAVEAECFIKTIRDRAEKMHEAYGTAFQYIMYRDLNKRMKMFEKLISERTYPPLLNPHLCEKERPL